MEKREGKRVIFFFVQRKHRDPALLRCIALQALEVRKLSEFSLNLQVGKRLILADGMKGGGQPQFPTGSSRAKMCKLICTH